MGYPPPLSSSKHAGVRSLFNRQDVKTGKIPKDLARIYNDLFERRQEGDYIDFVSFGESQVLPWISKAIEMRQIPLFFRPSERNPYRLTLSVTRSGDSGRLILRNNLSWSLSKWYNFATVILFARKLQASTAKSIPAIGPIQ